MKIPFMKQVSWCLIFAMFIVGAAPKVEAGFVPSEFIAFSGDDIVNVDRAVDMEKIQRTLEAKIIKDRLEKLGFTQDEINNRITQLSDQQVHQLAQQLDELKVGGDVGAVIGVLVIVVLVLVILQLTGHRVMVVR